MYNTIVARCVAPVFAIGSREPSASARSTSEAEYGPEGKSSGAVSLIKLIAARIDLSFADGGDLHFNQHLPQPAGASLILSLTQMFKGDRHWRLPQDEARPAWYPYFVRGTMTPNADIGWRESTSGRAH